MPMIMIYSNPRQRPEKMQKAEVEQTQRIISRPAARKKCYCEMRSATATTMSATTTPTRYLSLIQMLFTFLVFLLVAGSCCSAQSQAISESSPSSASLKGQQQHSVNAVDGQSSSSGQRLSAGNASGSAANCSASPDLCAELEHDRELTDFVNLILERTRRMRLSVGGGAVKSATNQHKNNRRSVYPSGQGVRSIVARERDTPTLVDDAETTPTLHIRTRSLNEVVKIVQRLSTDFAVSIDSADELPSVDQIYLGLRSADDQRNATEQQRVPKWTQRGHVCERVVARFFGFPESLLRYMAVKKKCQFFNKRYICQESYGTGVYAPTKKTILECCHGYELASTLENCRKSSFKLRTHRTRGKYKYARKGTRPSKVSFQSQPSRLFHRQHLSSSIEKKRRLRAKKKKQFLRAKQNKKKTKSRRREEEEDEVMVFTSFAPAEFDKDADVYVGRLLDNLVILDKYLTAEAFEDNMIYYAASGNPIRFNLFNNDVWTANCRKITAFERVRKENGVYHELDGMIPDVQDSIADYLEMRTSKFSDLFKAFSRISGLMNVLGERNRSLTLFAPSNAAFAALALPVADESASCLRELLQHYVVDDVFCAVGAGGKTLHTIDGGSLVTRIDEHDNVFVNESSLVNRDVMARNGVIHTIDRMLNPVRSLADLLGSEKALRFFYEFYEPSNKLADLSRARNATLLAPVNTAFLGDVRYDTYDVMDDPDLLRRQLEYYVVDSVLDRDTLQRSYHKNYRLTTHGQGRPVHVTLYQIKLKVDDDGGEVKKPMMGSAMSLQCARISVHQPTVSSCAGSILALDQLLKHPKESLMTVLGEDAEFSTLLGVITSNNLEYLLESDKDHTFFAPTNQIFTQFDPEVMNKLFGDPETARRIISFHLIPGFHCQDELLQRPYRHSTVIGQSVHSCPKESDVIWLGRHRRKLRARINRPDLLADNGIVHGIDNLLLPKHYDSIKFPSI